jgi:cytochrome c oxidase subunit 2
MHSLLLLAELKKSFWFPEQNSSFAAGVDGLFDAILWLSIFFFVLIIGLMVYFMFKYHRVEGVDPLPSPSHHTVLELTWTIIPSIIVVFLFGYGFAGYNDMRTPPPDAEVINVIAKQWKWLFVYSNGHSDSELHVTVGKPVKLVMQSVDVLHSMFVPVCRAKQDIVPGRYSMVWFDTLETGVFDIYCAEYCGKEHSIMTSKIHIHHTEGDDTFENWMKVASNPKVNPAYKGANGEYDPVKYGEDIYTKRGCNSCHTLDGKNNTGPTFKGNWGTDRDFTDGSKGIMDENYVRESILNPMAKIRKGFDPKMPSFSGQLTDVDIDAMIAFLKSKK